MVVFVVQSQPKVFSAGLDILEMYGKSPERCGEFWKAVQEMWLKLYGSDMITIAAINVRMDRLLPPSLLLKKPPFEAPFLPFIGLQSCRGLFNGSDLRLQDHGRSASLHHRSE